MRISKSTKIMEERIRNAIIAVLKLLPSDTSVDGLTKGELISWLEDQKEPELTEFEKALAEIIHSWAEPNESPFNVPEALREDAEKLLSIARKEVLKLNDIVIKNWQDLQNIYIIMARHFKGLDNGPLDKFPSSTEDLFTHILETIKDERL